MLIFFKIIWVIDALLSLIVLYFFFEGLTDGTVSGSNFGLWLFILLGIAVIMLGSIWLKSHQHTGLGVILLLLPAVPAVLYFLILIFAFTAGVRWN